MGTINTVRHFNQKASRKGRVWFPGSTQVRKGMGLCYDLDIVSTNTGETATDPWGRRYNSVAVPDNTNNLAFAGVASQNYKAMANGQLIDIHKPGGVAEIAVGLGTTINGANVTCSVNSADAGRFTLQGLPGRGTAMPLQTITAATGGDLAHANLAGTATTSWSAPSLTITSTGIGTAVGFGDADIDPTEYVVVVLGGADDATGGDATTGELATTGAYPIVTAPTADTVTIATDIGDVDATIYVIKNTYPTVLAYLYDGEESGCQEVITPQDATAVQSMVGGTSILCGGYTMAADSTATLADGIKIGQHKAFAALGTLTTQDWLLTVTSGLQMDATALATLEFDAANDFAELVWSSAGNSNAGVWREVARVGATAA
jgi:hypothetical protein